MCLRLVHIGNQCLVIIFFDLIITTSTHLIVLIILTEKSLENFIRLKGVAKIFIRLKGVASKKVWEALLHTILISELKLTMFDLFF